VGRHVATCDHELGSADDTSFSGAPPTTCRTTEHEARGCVGAKRDDLSEHVREKRSYAARDPDLCALQTPSNTSTQRSPAVSHLGVIEDTAKSNDDGYAVRTSIDGRLHLSSV
jgi:hypothetical protein